ncbi:unnamed protein product [Sphagnum balticum]
MASHVVGYPCMGPKRELKFALESFWEGKSSDADLEALAKDLRASIWKQMADAGITLIPSNIFSYYDQVLDTTALVGAVPPLYGWTGGGIGLDVYFSMVHGNATKPAMEVTKWFDTNYHFIVPELGPATKFSYSSQKAVNEYKGSQGDYGNACNREVIGELKEAGAKWVQLDEPSLVLDLEASQLEAFKKAYSFLGADLGGLKLLLETYFADIPAAAYKALLGLEHVSAIGVDLVCGAKTVSLIKEFGLPGKILFAGVVDGHNIWSNDLAASVTVIEEMQHALGKENVVVSTSCSLLHTVLDLKNETKLDAELKSWRAFTAQKLLEDFFAANASAHASRRSSPRVHNRAFQEASAALKTSDHRRATPVGTCLEEQQKHLNLPILPTTTIGSFPQTAELRRVCRDVKSKKWQSGLSRHYFVGVQMCKLKTPYADVYFLYLLQRNDMVEYFGWRHATQIALAIKDEVEDLEAGGINVIQIDEAALWEGLPLCKSEQADYQNWAVHGSTSPHLFHTHMCYSNFNDIIHSIIDMDADVITIENSRSDENLLSVFREGVVYGAGIGTGVYDIHSPRIPSTEEMAERARKMLAVLESKVLWINPDCGLKTRKYAEVVPALTNMVNASKQLQTELAK